MLYVLHINQAHALSVNHHILEHLLLHISQKQHNCLSCMIVIMFNHVISYSNSTSSLFCCFSKCRTFKLLAGFTSCLSKAWRIHLCSTTANDAFVVLVPPSPLVTEFITFILESTVSQLRQILACTDHPCALFHGFNVTIWQNLRVDNLWRLGMEVLQVQ